MAQLFLLALFAILPRVPQPQRACIDRHRAAIEASADAAALETGVPVGVLLVTAFVETHLGCDRGEGGGWGAPVDVRHRHTAGTPAHAARALARSYVACGGASWTRAVRRFRSGNCATTNRVHNAYAAQVMRLVAAGYARARMPPPAHLR